MSAHGLSWHAPLLTLALALALALLGVGVVRADPAGLSVREAWTRPTAPGAPSAAGFLTLANVNGVDDRLLGASSPRAARVELHRSVEAEGIAGMRAVTDGVPIAAGARLQLAPSGLHLMLIGLAAPLLPGERIPLTLHFASGASVPAALHVETMAPEAPRAPVAGGHGHH